MVLGVFENGSHEFLRDSHEDCGMIIPKSCNQKQPKAASILDQLPVGSMVFENGMVNLSKKNDPNFQVPPTIRLKEGQWQNLLCY
jgi:hypothetical protein